MEVKFCDKTFAEIKNGDVFVCSPNGESLVIKILPCKENDRDMNAVRLDDGKLFHFNDSDKVYPVSCIILRNP